MFWRHRNVQSQQPEESRPMQYPQRPQQLQKSSESSAETDQEIRFNYFRTVNDLVRDRFSFAQVAALVDAKEQYRCGELNELALDYRCLRFARWLYEQGRISG